MLLLEYILTDSYMLHVIFLPYIFVQKISFKFQFHKSVLEMLEKWIQAVFCVLFLTQKVELINSLQNPSVAGPLAVRSSQLWPWLWSNLGLGDGLHVSTALSSLHCREALLQTVQCSAQYVQYIATLNCTKCTTHCTVCTALHTALYVHCTRPCIATEDSHSPYSVWHNI